MSADDLLKQARLDEALKSLQDQIRNDPANPRPRVFLFQLLCVLGDWKRAHTQLKVLADMDADCLMLARIFEPIVTCEIFREEVFAGNRTPLIFGEPPVWMGPLIQALSYYSKGEYQAGRELRDEAFAAAPAIAGRINGTAFTWMADSDERVGPSLELILNGSYFWVPFERISKVILEAPTDLRDLVWTPAHFVWTNGGEASGHIPTRYPGTAQSTDNELRLARKNERIEHDDVQFCLGQREFVTDQAEYLLLETRTIEFGAME
jgi:type VI secretion system protein ImpE